MKIKAAACAGLTGGLEWASPGTERVELEQLFPLPTFVPPRGCRSLGGHARARQRIRRHFVDEANSAIDALYWYAGSRSSREVKTRDELTPLQQQVTARVEGLIEAMHDSTFAIPAPQAAFSELPRGRRCYDDGRVPDSMSLATPLRRTYLFRRLLQGRLFWTRFCLLLCTNTSVTQWSGC